MTYQQLLLAVYCIYLAIFSLTAFVAFGKDKQMSKGGTEKRIKEKTLLFLTVFGGGIGAYLGRVFFHHKTKKIYFTITIYAALILQLAVLGLMFILAF